MDYKDIANRLRKWANGETCEDCPAKDDLAFCAADTIRELLSKVEELEAKNRILEEARENANEACAKWEGLYRAKLGKESGWISVKDRLPEDYQRVLCLFESGTMEVSFRASVKGFCYEGFKQTGKVTHWIPLPEPPKEE